MANLGISNMGGARPGSFAFSQQQKKQPKAAAPEAPAAPTPAAPAAPAAPAPGPLSLSALYTPYEQPAGPSQAAKDAGTVTGPGGTAAQPATQQLRDVQQQALTGFSSLMQQDPYANVGALTSAIYDPQAQSIDQAAADQYHQMIEGNFARGVGSSSITTEMAGRLAKAHDQALANAKQNATVAAYSQANQDLAARQGLLQGGFTAGTSGLQGEANIGLANAGNALGANQFAQQLYAQQQQNAAQLGQQASQFGQNLGLQYANLSQQANQFSQQLAFTGQQNDANRALQSAMQASQYQFTGDQAGLQRAFEQQMAQMGYNFQTGSQQSNQAFQQAMQQAQFGQQTGLANLNQQNQMALLGAQQTFQAGQTTAAQNWQAQQTQAAQNWQGSQNDLNRALSQWTVQQQLAAQGDATAQRIVAGGIQSFLTGLGALAGAMYNPG